jgi:glycosyltransferase involved in cell wall biosynthesis
MKERVASGPAITVVIPAHNEQEAIAPQIKSVDDVLKETGREYEIIVVDDGSTDETAARARDCGAGLLHLDQKHGYGAALKAGIAQARFDWILIIDADLTYPAAAIPRLLDRIPEYDMAVGARVEKGAAIPLVRRPAKWFLRHYASYSVGTGIPDLNSGMRLMRKAVVQEFLHLLPSVSRLQARSRCPCSRTDTRFTTSLSLISSASDTPKSGPRISSAFSP